MGSYMFIVEKIVPRLEQAAPWLSRFSPTFVDATDIELLSLYAS